MKKLKVGLIILVAMLLPVGVFAAEFKSEQTYTLSKNQVVDDDLFVSGQGVVIDGHVKGDVFAVGNDVKVDGQIDGSLFTAGANVTVNGTIGNDLYAAGGTVKVNGSVADNVYNAGGMVTASEDFSVGRDYFVGCGNADLKGKVKRNLFGSCGGMNLENQIGGNANLTVGSENTKEASTEPLVIGENARVNGNLEYLSNSTAKIAPGAVISGETKYKTFPVKPQSAHKNVKRSNAFGFGSFFKLMCFFGFLILTLVVTWLCQKKEKAMTAVLRKSYGRSVGVGALVLVLAPIIILTLAITILGLPLAFLTVAVYYVLLVISKVVFSMFLGEVTLKTLFKGKKFSPYLEVLVGAFIISVFFVIPFIGFFVKLIVMSFGLGAIILYCFEQRKVEKTAVIASKVDLPKKTVRTKKTVKKTVK